MIEHQPTIGGLTWRAVTRSLGGIVKLDRRRPLPRLADAHLGRPAAGRWIGIRTVPTECVRGTASAARWRRMDFRPMAGHAPADWRSRWARLQSAESDQVVLPPVQLIRAGGVYWVVDGHNRVALARERGQRWIDAEITEVDVTSTSTAAGAAKEN